MKRTSLFLIFGYLFFALVLVACSPSGGKKRRPPRRTMGIQPLKVLTVEAAIKPLSLVLPLPKPVAKTFLPLARLMA